MITHWGGRVTGRLTKPTPGTLLQKKAIADAAVTLMDTLTALNERTEVVFVQILNAPVRYTSDGSTPTNSVAAGHGVRGYDGATLELTVAEANAVQLIREGATSAQVVIWEGQYV